MKINYVSMFASPSHESIDLVGELESRLLAPIADGKPVLDEPIRRLKWNEVLDGDHRRLWGPDTLVWFDQSFAQQSYVQLTDGVIPQSVNAMFMSTRAGVHSFDLTKDDYPMFLPGDQRLYIIEFTNDVYKPLYETFGCPVSRVTASPFYDWAALREPDFWSVQREYYARHTLAGMPGKIALVVLDYTSTTDLMAIHNFFPRDWGVVYYLPWTRTGEVGLEGDERVRAVGSDVDLLKLAGCCDLIFTDRFMGPEFDAVHMRAGANVIAPRTTAMRLDSEAGAQYFTRFIHPFRRSVSHVDMDFEDHMPPYVMHSKVRAAIDLLAQDPATRRPTAEYEPLAASREEAIDAIAALIVTIRGRLLDAKKIFSHVFGS